MPKPLVSILIPCFNGGPWLHRSIETALAQTWPSKEVIVLNDGSTDNSLEIMRRYTGQANIVSQPNSGQNASRNHLAELSRGEWLLYLDADDELAAEGVERKIVYADTADAIYGTCEVATFIGPTKVHSTLTRAVEYDDPIEAAFTWSFPNTSSFLFRRSALVDVGGWNTKIKNCTDYDLYFRLLLGGKIFRAATDSLSLYRQWSNAQAVRENPLRLARTRLQIMWDVMRRLKAANGLNPRCRAAFEREAFGVIRTIAGLNLAEAVDHHARLIDHNPRFRPSSCTGRYQVAYCIGGFIFAETVAALGRKLKPAWKFQSQRD